MLVTTDALLTALAVRNRSDPAIVSRFDLLRRQVEAAVKSYVKWEIEAATNQVDYYDGNGYIDIVLRRPFVSSVIDVWLDQTGRYGDGPSAFAAATKLIKGTDYVLVRDQGTTGKSGLLRRLSNTSYWFPSDLVFNRRAGGLSYGSRPFWAAGYGNIKVQYDYGFTVIPDDIKLAVETACSIIINTVRFGWPIQSESLADYSYSLNISRDIEFGTVRQLLGPYRDQPV